VTCTYAYTVTQLDINGGNFTVNIAYGAAQARSRSLPAFVGSPVSFLTEAQPEPELRIVNDLTSGNMFQEIGE
jgi:hypothetical protein